MAWSRWLTGNDTDLSLRMCAELHWYAFLRCQSELFRWAEVSAAAAAGSRSPFYPEVLASAAWGGSLRNRGGDITDDLHDRVDRLLVLIVPVHDVVPRRAEVETGVDLVVRGNASLDELPVLGQ